MILSPSVITATAPFLNAGINIAIAISGFAAHGNKDQSRLHATGIVINAGNFRIAIAGSNPVPRNS